LFCQILFLCAKSILFINSTNKKKKKFVPNRKRIVKISITFENAILKRERERERERVHESKQTGEKNFLQINEKFFF
jgi:hypothetical protein